METQTANTNGRRRVGFFANYEHLVETIETTLPKGEMKRLYHEYLTTEEREEYGFSGFLGFLDSRGFYHKIVNGTDRHHIDEVISMS